MESSPPRRPSRKYLLAALALPLGLGVLALVAPVHSFTGRCGSVRAGQNEAVDVRAVHLTCAEALPVASAWVRRPRLSFRSPGSDLDFRCRYLPFVSQLPRTVCSRGNWQRVEFQAYASQP